MIGLPPPCDIVIEIEGERRDALLSALRRGACAEATELLDGWTFAWSPVEVRDLSRWVCDECRRHVAAGRFQYALALLDRYLLLPPLFTAADVKSSHPRMSSR